jgi:uncharacterized membrane protein (DUF373 family)
VERDFLGWVERAERGIYWAVGLSLILGAAAFLAFTVWQAALGFTSGSFALTTLQLFDRLLFALMLAQIVYTTLSFLRVGSLQVEPVLVVGIIAVVRRILVVTAVLGGTMRETGSTAETFQEIVAELGLLAVTVLALSVAVYLLRRTRVDAGREPASGTVAAPRSTGA